MTEKIVSYSEMSVYIECPQKHCWSYDRRIEPATLSIPLQLGNMVHQMMAAWYRTPSSVTSIEARNQVIAAFSKPTDEDSDEVYEEQATKQETMLRKAEQCLRLYVEQYRKDPLRSSVINVESPVKFDLGYGITLLTIPDAVADIRGKLWCIEHKSGNPSGDFLALYDLQSALNCLAVGAEGTIFNLFLTGGAKVSIERVIMERTLAEKQYALSHAIAVAMKIVGDVKKVMHRSRNCLWCDYKSLCLSLIEGSDTEWLVQNSYRPRKSRQEIIND